jgi:hypothetical protein
VRSKPTVVTANEGVDIAGELIITTVKASRMAVAANEGIDIAASLINCESKLNGGRGQ